jgi:membrane associated rhomboid family serine protease
MSEPSGSGPPSGPTCHRHPGREARISCQRCGRAICPDCMRDAAVGFQSPSCVSEGARSTRQARTTYGGRRSDNPALTSMVLIGVNVAVWLALLASGGVRSRLYDLLALLPAGRCVPAGDAASYYPRLGAEGVCTQSADRLWVAGVADGAWWQLITSAFAHVEIWHIGFNMLVLWALGPQVEALLGRGRFLALYLLSALAGSVMVFWLAEPAGSTLGASGATFGLLGALVIIRFRTHREMSQLALFAGIFVLISVIGPDSISWEGHLGGVLGGAAAAAVLVWAPRGPRRATVQVAGLVLIGVVLLALVALRALMLA